MASLTITVPDAVVPRILAALGASNAADVAVWIKNQVKLQVIQYEAGQADLAKQSAVNAEQW